MNEVNKELSRIFKEMSVMYQYLGRDDRFRSLAYGKAARVIDSLSDDISIHIKEHSLKQLPGIGEGISQKIEEYMATGEIKKYEQLKKRVPYQLMELMEIRGFGPKTLKQIHDQLKITTKKQLIDALTNGGIAKLKRFGEKKTQGLLRGLKLHKILEERMLLWDALEAAEKILQELKTIEGVKQTEVAGSLRRKKETIGDIDILVSCDEKNRRTIVDSISEKDFVKRVLAKGNTKISVILKASGKQMDIRIVNPDEWGSALQYFSGSKEHNIHLRSIAKEKGYKMSEYGIFNIRTNKRVVHEKEEDIYRMLGFQFIPPEMREDKGEIELAAKNKIPKLISLQDIKGDMQMHSTWSDGLSTIEEIAKYLRQNSSYKYIVITDHSKSSRIANGLTEKQILQQLKEIEKVNKQLGESFVKKGIEVDILSNGDLDISNEILSQLDWVTASIHRNFNHDNTERIIKACENPYVNCIGHPTGRLIGTREPYKINIEKVIEVAKLNNTALEINAYPTRMDLNEEYIMLARQKGANLVINTDSHTLENFNFMKLGVYMAQRAWCTKEDILNTRSWNEIKTFTSRKLNKNIKELVEH